MQELWQECIPSHGNEAWVRSFIGAHVHAFVRDMHLQSRAPITSARSFSFNPQDPLNNTNSPYRGKNYKLLLDVITKAAIRAYRSELRIRGDRYTLNWVERFMHKNDGDGKPNLKASDS